MDWVAAKSYYIGYSSIDRFLSICFVHYHLLTWSIAFLCSFILPLLYILAPGSLRTTRTTHFLIICLVCLSYMSSLYVQIYMISNGGEPNLPYHPCRFIVYVSTFAKPMGIYLTLLFSMERLFTKIISKLVLRTNTYRILFQRLYAGLIFLILIFIFSKRLYEVLKLLPRDQPTGGEQSSDLDIDSRIDITDTSNNSTDRNITFKYCFSSVNIDAYAKILSFYVIQGWWEYLLVAIISLVLFIVTLQQCCLSRTQRQQQSALRQFSVNTKLYLCLASCVAGSELVLLFLHFIVDDVNNNNTDLQLTSLQFMLFAFNFRCIVLPLAVCMTTCEPLKQLFYELFILRPYLDNIDENDNPETMDNRPEPFSSPPRTSNRIQEKLRRTFKRNHNNHNDHFNNDELQGDL